MMSHQLHGIIRGCRADEGEREAEISVNDGKSRLDQAKCRSRCCGDRNVSGVRIKSGYRAREIRSQVHVRSQADAARKSRQ